MVTVKHGPGLYDGGGGAFAPTPPANWRICKQALRWRWLTIYFPLQIRQRPLVYHAGKSDVLLAPPAAPHLVNGNALRLDAISPNEALTAKWT